MLESKRKFRRFDMSPGVKFRPTYGAIEYSAGTAKNLSCDGLGLDAHDFRFILYENLELIIDIPGSGDPVSLFGDIMWKRQDGKRCSAGVKFRMKDKNAQEEATGKIISSLINKPPDLPNKLGIVITQGFGDAHKYLFFS